MLKVILQGVFLETSQVILSPFRMARQQVKVFPTSHTFQILTPSTYLSHIKNNNKKVKQFSSTNLTICGHHLTPQ